MKRCVINRHRNGRRISWGLQAGSRAESQPNAKKVDEQRKVRRENDILLRERVPRSTTYGARGNTFSKSLSSTEDLVQMPRCFVKKIWKSIWGIGCISKDFPLKVTRETSIGHSEL
ncbi:hypothetical protein ACJRO7_001901 [Eucalyptus globulus]|uniref:Uncharacterized protein n=1 Tax=Eucalyptus globulus TaxID=34317 RepID=A0ABD3LSI6_EUCGL